MSTTGAALIVAATATTALATGTAPDASALIGQPLVEEMRGVITNEIVTLSLRESNVARSGITQTEVLRLDESWRAEREASVMPLITAALLSPLSSYLTRVQAGSTGLITEIIVVDASGLNVGQSNITSDMWQGDEAKFTETFPKGPDAVFIDVAEFHDGTATWRAQLNMTVPDPSTGEALGAVTFEINLTELQRRERAQ